MATWRSLRGPHFLLRKFNKRNHMKTFAFISRYLPTVGQLQLAADQGVELIHVGDTDGFSVTPEWVLQKGKFDGVAVVHAGAALRLAPYFLIALFENSDRAPVGAPPQFEAVGMHMFDLRYNEGFVHHTEFVCGSTQLYNDLNRCKEIVDRLEKTDMLHLTVKRARYWTTEEQVYPIAGDNP